MATYESDEESTFSLWPERYEFPVYNKDLWPKTAPFNHAANFVTIGFSYRGRTRYDAALLTYELQYLIQYLKDPQEELSFLEPNLKLSCARPTEIQLYVGWELHPSYEKQDMGPSGEREYLCLTLNTSTPAFQVFVDELEREAKEFPVR